MRDDISFWLGIVGFFATFIFGWLSIYLVKSKKYPGALTFISEQTISLFDALVKNFPQISIKYDGENINKQIVMLKGFIINSGSIDIKNDMVAENLKLKLPPNSKWLNVKIVDSTVGGNSTAAINNNELTFDLGLFRKGEFLGFEALADIAEITEKSKDGQILTDLLQFDHRIADTSKVEVMSIDLRIPNIKRRLLSRVFMPLLMFIYLIAMIFSIYNRDIPATFEYHVKDHNEYFAVKATPLITNKIDLKRADGSDYKTVSLNEFNQMLVKAKITELKDDGWITKVLGVNGLYWLMVIVFSFMFLMMLFMYVINPVLEFRKLKSIRRSLNMKDSN